MLEVSSIREGETSWHCNGSGSNGIQLMTKLTEGLTPAGADKAALSLCIYSICILVCLRVCVGDNTLHCLWKAGERREGRKGKAKGEQER